MSSTKSDYTYLTVPEIASRYRVRVETVWDWLRSGRLIGFKAAGSRWRVRQDALEEWERRHQPGER